jgi:acyl-coenzyme A thioesterase PaaI-like protein
MQVFQAVPLAHHELCFGCGAANVFGLHLELERTGEGGLSGRFFVKQDHQGPDGSAHAGVLAAALTEALSLAAGSPPTSIGVDVLGTARVGTFVRVETDAEGSRAVASGDDGEVAVAWPRT